MKKSRIGALALTTCLCLLGSATADPAVWPSALTWPTNQTLSIDAAIEAAKSEAERAEGVPLGDLSGDKVRASLVRLESGEDAWMVMIDRVLKTDALVTLNAVNGTILDYQSTDTEIVSLLVKQWHQKLGDTFDWSMEDALLFDNLFGDSDEVIAPRDGDLSAQEAERIALEALPETLSKPQCSTHFTRYPNATDDSAERYVWHVTIREGGQDQYVVYVSPSDGTVLSFFKPSNHG